MILTQMTPLKQRLIVSSIGTFIVLITIFLAPVPIFKPLFSLAVAFMIGTAMHELYNIAQAKGWQPAEKLGLVITFLYTSAVTIGTQYPAIKMLPESTLLFSLLICFSYYFIKGTNPLINLSLTFFSIAYLVVPLTCMISIVYFFSESGAQDGRLWLLYLIAVAKMTDTGGYFIGRQFGKQKLAPYISPKKTWEGALGGLCAAIVTSFIVTALAFIFDGAFIITFWQNLLLSICIGVVAQCGDLAESLLKRDGGIKDSSHLPGLGGMLDIVDSLVFTAPLVYIFLKIYV